MLRVFGDRSISWHKENLAQMRYLHQPGEGMGGLVEVEGHLIFKKANRKGQAGYAITAYGYGEGF